MLSLIIYFRKIVFLMVPGVLLILQTAYPQDTGRGSSNPAAEAKYQEARAIAANMDATREELNIAIQKVEAALAVAPESCKYNFGMGILYYRLKDWDQAESWFSKASQYQSNECTVADIDGWLARAREKKIAARNVLAVAGEVKVTRHIELKDPDADREYDPVMDRPVLPRAAVKDSSDALRHFFASRFSDFNFYRKGPFLLAGRDNDEQLAKYYRRGIKDAYRYFMQEYSFSEPSYIITVLLSDMPHKLITISEKIYPEQRFPVYNPFFGFFSRTDHLIVATIGGGYGTLLHEMMHALVANDFPDAPLWLDEGLATLYERSVWTPTRLTPLPNWRMEILGFQDDTPLSAFEDILHENRLGREDLARVRLLFLFLDKQDHVRDLYHAVRQDPRNFDFQATLTSFGDDFSQEKWQAFVKSTVADYRTEVRLESSARPYQETLFIQKALNRVTKAGLNEDGVWGPDTRKRLIEFQTRNGIKGSGEYNDETRSLLESQFGVADL